MGPAPPPFYNLGVRSFVRRRHHVSPVPSPEAGAGLTYEQIA
jgi:hypothetical protein